MVDGEAGGTPRTRPRLTPDSAGGWCPFRPRRRARSARRLASNGSIDKPATAGDSFGTVIAFLPGVVMPRRVLALVAILGTLAVIACQGAPAAPPISDPKEILAKTVLSLKDVKTVDVRGELTGTALVGGTGTLDLKGTTIDLAADIPAKKAKLSLSAPSLLGT